MVVESLGRLSLSIYPIVSVEFKQLSLFHSVIEVDFDVCTNSGMVFQFPCFHNLSGAQCLCRVDLECYQQFFEASYINTDEL